MENNIKVFFTAEYYDKENGEMKWEEKVQGTIFDLPVLENKIDEAVGRLIHHIGKFRDDEPLPE